MSYLLFDIGGTNLRLAYSPDGHTLTKVERLATPATAQEGVRNILEYAQAVSRQVPLTSAAGCLPGPMDKDKTMVINAPNIPGWNNYPLRQELAGKLDTPVWLENDAAAAGLGEAMFGPGQDKKIVVYLTVSTGLGGTRIVGGKIDSNSLGFEPGHHIIHEDGLMCRCGTRGHLEAYASGSGLKKHFGKPAHEISDPAIWGQVAHYLAIGLNNVICFWSPDIIILGGSLIKSLSIEAISEELVGLKPVFPILPPIEKAKLGDESGLYGALAYLRSLSAN
ncbi:MAG: ROK family protein [Candidatus Andersenbacteria bacterium]|nr:ROK family protein [Candidatus Andersenbacteria bacterium]